MILVDSSVWIDYFGNRETWQVGRLETLLEDEELAVGDLIVAEVLQGTRQERDFRLVLSAFADLQLVEIGGAEIAVDAARLYRFLRARGITIRATIDTLIAARCIRDGLHLLHNDRDFQPFADHLGLQVIRPH
jgi:predicted nucleic acid-binding protein